jgi:hypothetical protein
MLKRLFVPEREELTVYCIELRNVELCKSYSSQTALGLQNLIESWAGHVATLIETTGE